MGERLASPDLDIEGRPYQSWVQRSGFVERVGYKNRERLFSVIARFACQDHEVVRLNWVRVDMHDPDTYRDMGRSMVSHTELDGDPHTLHKRLDVIEAGVTAIELDNGIMQPKIAAVLLQLESGPSREVSQSI